MEVTKYIFQSPYSSSIQVGRPDPSSQKQEENSSAVDNLSNAGNQSIKDAKTYEQQISKPVSVNVALSTTDSGLSESLASFSTLNSLSLAQEAY